MADRPTGHDRAVTAALRLSGFDSARRIPDLGRTGSVPVVQRQWWSVVEDSGALTAACELSRSVSLVERLMRGPARRVGRGLPRVLDDIACAVGRLTRASVEISWFAVDTNDDLLRHVEDVLAQANAVLEAFAESLAGVENPDVAGALDRLEGGSENLERALSGASDDGGAPATLVSHVLKTDDWNPRDVALGGLRRATPLDEAELAELSRRLLAHLTVPDSEWPPGVDVLAGLLILERPLIGHRCAEATRELITDHAARDPYVTAHLLGPFRQRHERSYASHREIVAILNELRAAGERDDAEAQALSTARLYAAQTEGPLRAATRCLLRLLGEEVAEDTKLAEVRDRLAKYSSEISVAADAVAAIETEWRNAVDHRQMHWDPRTARLVLREADVEPDQVFAKYALAAGVAMGVEAGIGLALAASPALRETINDVAPAHADRILVEHRIASLLGAQKADATVTTLSDRLAIRVPGPEDMLKAVASCVTALTDLQSIGVVQIDVDDMPPLLATLDSLTRVQRLSQLVDDGTLGPDSLSPIFADSLIANGMAPREALETVVDKVLRTVVDAAVPPGPAIQNTDTARRALARVIASAAAKTLLTIHEVQGVAAVESPGVDRAITALRRLEDAAAAYGKRREYTSDALLRALPAFRRAHEALPGEGLPWFRAADTA